MRKTLIVGDLHLGKGLAIGKPAIGDVPNSRILDQSNILRWILSQAISKDAEKIILAGDVFQERKPDTSIIYLFMDWLYDCSINNIAVHIISGNHDLKRIAQKYYSPLDLIKLACIPNVFVYNSVTTIEANGINYILLPFRDKKAMEVENVSQALNLIQASLDFELSTANNNNKNVLVGHMALEGSMYTDEVDDLSNEIMIPLDDLGGFDFVWMGHVHKPQALRQVPHIAHIGSVDISDFGETDQTKIIVEMDEVTQQFTEIPIPTRPLRRIRLDIPKKEDPTLFLENYINSNPDYLNALVKLEIKLLDPHSVPTDRVKISKLLYDIGAYHICCFSETKNITVVTTDKKKTSDATISAPTAVKLWADTIDHQNDEEKQAFITLCLEIIKEGAK